MVCIVVNLQASMNKQTVIFRDLGQKDYKSCWDYQEQLLQENVRKKSLVYSFEAVTADAESQSINSGSSTSHYLLFVEHPPVYTLGKSGHIENLLISEKERE